MIGGEYSYMKLHNFIIERLPFIDGYGECGREYDDNGISNHSAFKQSIRENVQGDVGVFIIQTNETTKMSGHSEYKSEVQIVVNCINGDIDSAIDYLSKALENIKKNNKNEFIWVKNCKFVNMSPVGKNSSGIHWCVLNILLTYITNED